MCFQYPHCIKNENWSLLRIVFDFVFLAISVVARVCGRAIIHDALFRWCLAGVAVELYSLVLTKSRKHTLHFVYRQHNYRVEDWAAYISAYLSF